MYKAQRLPLLLQEKTYSCLQIWQEFNAENVSTYQAGTFRETPLLQQDLQMPYSNLAPVSKTVCAQIRIPSLKWCTLLNTDQAMPQVRVHIRILKTHKNKSSSLTPKYLSFFDRKQSHILLTSDASLSSFWPTCIWKLFWGTSGPCTKFMKLKKREISWNSVETQRGLLYFFLLYLSSCNTLLVDTDIKRVFKIFMRLLNWKAVSGEVLLADKAACWKGQAFGASGSWTLELYRAFNGIHMCR